MRERAQASVETIALMAAALALAAVLLLGVVAPRAAARVGARARRSRASSRRASRRRRASTGSSAPCSPAPPARTPTARRCSTCARTCARASIAPPRTPRSPPSCGRSSSARSRRRRSTAEPGAIAIVDRATEDAWLREPAFTRRDCDRAAELVVGLAGRAIRVFAVIGDLGDRLRRARPTASRPGTPPATSSSGSTAAPCGDVVLRRRSRRSGSRRDRHRPTRAAMPRAGRRAR